MEAMRMKQYRLVILITALWLAVVLSMQPLVFAQESMLEEGEITSPALADNLIGDTATRSYIVYLPPSYETSNKLYPVFYVLHGFSGNYRSHSYSVKSALDKMIADEECGEMIGVFVDGSNKFVGSWFLSSQTIGDYESYIVRDLVDHIDANYRTTAHRDTRGITGFSMGGYGALHLALKYPEVFSVVDTQAGAPPYDINDADWWVGECEKVALNAPKTWDDFQRLGLYPKVAWSYSAAVSPNPDKPPFFLDPPFEVLNGEAQFLPEVWKLHEENDIVHGHLERYLEQPVKLKGIQIVHGILDGTVPVSQARSVDAAMTDLGIDHVYDEHEGGHSFFPDKALTFLWNRFFNIVEVGTNDRLPTIWGRIKGMHRE
jgi:enterochelin esterase-like enzyme